MRVNSKKVSGVENPNMGGNNGKGNKAHGQNNK
jgi:hypothetical protein